MFVSNTLSTQNSIAKNPYGGLHLLLILSLSSVLMTNLGEGLFQNTVPITEQHLQTQNPDLVCPLSLYRPVGFLHYITGNSS